MWWCVKCDVDETEEISIKEETIDIKVEIPEAIISPSIEPEVRLQVVCKVVAAFTS